MAYDEHYPTGPAGPIAGLAWVKACLDVALRSVPASKLQLGEAGYGYRWYPDGRATSIGDAQARRIAAAPGWPPPGTRLRASGMSRCQTGRSCGGPTPDHRRWTPSLPPRRTCVGSASGSSSSPTLVLAALRGWRTPPRLLRRISPGRLLPLPGHARAPTRRLSGPHCPRHVGRAWRSRRIGRAPTRQTRTFPPQAGGSPNSDGTDRAWRGPTPHSRHVKLLRTGTTSTPSPGAADGGFPLTSPGWSSWAPWRAGRAPTVAKQGRGPGTPRASSKASSTLSPTGTGVVNIPEARTRSTFLWAVR